MNGASAGTVKCGCPVFSVQHTSRGQRVSGTAWDLLQVATVRGLAALMSTREMPTLFATSKIRSSR